MKSLTARDKIVRLQIWVRKRNKKYIFYIFLSFIYLFFPFRTRNLILNEIFYFFSKIIYRAGQEKYRTVTSSYYRTSNGILVVFDISEQKTFDNVEMWLEEIEKYASPHVFKLLIGNKIDLEKERQVPKETAQQVANKHS